MLAATLYQDPDMNHKLWHIVSSKKYITFPTFLLQFDWDSASQIWRKLQIIARKKNKKKKKKRKQTNKQKTKTKTKSKKNKDIFVYITLCANPNFLTFAKQIYHSEYLSYEINLTNASFYTNYCTTNTNYLL